MKKVLYGLVISSLLLSCRSNTKKTDKDSVANNSQTDQTQQIIKKFKPIIQGVWVKSDYIDEVAKTKSPLKAFSKASPITTMIIETEFVKGDSILIDIGYGNHEGGNLLIKFHPGHSISSIMAYTPGGNIENSFYELKYSISKDTTLTLYTYNERKKLVDSAHYFKAFNSTHVKELGYATNYMVNKALKLGAYTLIDTLNHASKISFTQDGNVSGLSDFKTFYINIDFTTPPNNLDEIIFDLYSKKQKSYAFNIDADTLKLFETFLSKDSIDLVLSKLKYKLVKNK